MATAAATARPAGVFRPRRAVTTGVVGGVVGVYLAAVGVIERFNEHELIVDVVSLGYVLFLISLLATGYRAATAKGEFGEQVPLSAGTRLFGGLIGGAVAGAVVGLFVLLFTAIEADFFVNVTPQLIEDILSFGQAGGTGALLLVGLGAGVGLVGGALHLLRPRDRRALFIGLGAVIGAGTLEGLVSQIIESLNFPSDFLYESSGLSLQGAAIVFVLAGGLSLLWAHREGLVRRFRRGGRATDSRATEVPPPAQTEEHDVVSAVQVAELSAPPDRGDKIALGVALAGLGLALVIAVLAFTDEEVDATLLLIALIVGGIGTGMASARTRSAMREGRSRTMSTMAFVAGLAGLFAILPLLAGSFYSDVLGTVGLYVMLGLGLNIVVGFAGLLDLGYVAFFAFGAYTTALLTSPLSGLVADIGEFGSGSQVPGDPVMSFWLALPIAVIVSVIAGILLGAPVVRLRGDYLAIVTLGFGEIIRVIVQSDWAAGLLGGSQGIKRIPAPPPEFLDLRDPQRMFYLILLGCLLMAYVSWRLQFSRVGRAWAAMREDEDVAEAMGISIIKYKLLAFAIGAGVASLGGIFFAAKIGVTTPESFQLLVSISVLALVILGGMGSIPGVIVGAVVLVGLPELLREFAVEYRYLFYGAALVAIMLLKPEGLIPNTRRRRELQEREAEEAQFEQRSGEPTPEPVIKPGAAAEKTTPKEEKK
jgi:ABC-type branched-subunit amino acid transport system permease subunit